MFVQVIQGKVSDRAPELAERMAGMQSLAVGPPSLLDLRDPRPDAPT